MALATVEPEELAADNLYVVVDVAVTDTEPLALVDVNVPGVMERVVAPLLTQVSVVLEPELMLAGLALNDVMVGADPLVGEGLGEHKLHQDTRHGVTSLGVEPVPDPGLR